MIRLFDLSMSAYIEKLKDPRWQKLRLEALSRDDWSCVKCGNNRDQLHVHHKKYHGDPWETPLEDMETLCKNCHNKTHTGRFKSRVNGKFIRGPIELKWMKRASKTRSSALCGMALWYQAGLERKLRFKVSPKKFRKLGIENKVRYTGLRILHDSGLITLEPQGRGKCPIVTLHYIQN